MSKELEALKRIKKLLEDKYGLLIYVDDLDLIETALKRLEKYDDEELEYDHANRGLTIELLCRENHKLVKEHKALEIIKEIFKIEISIDDYIDTVKPCGMVFLYDKDIVRTIYKTFDKENIQKLKLLKEVLL